MQKISKVLSMKLAPCKGIKSSMYTVESIWPKSLWEGIKGDLL